jgi:small GTP-binding protein
MNQNNFEKFNNFNNLEYEFFPFIVIGTEMVGKSSLVNRFVDNSFNENINRTLAIDYKSKKIYNNNITKVIRIWDTAGQERYNSITQSYYKKGDCILLCFSIINEKSFDNLESYISTIKLYAKSGVLIILVGTHQDKENIRIVTQEKIKQFLNTYSFEYFEISSKTGIGINELFNRCIELLSKNKKKIIYDTESYYSDNKIKVNKNRYQTMCCAIS